MGNWKGRRFRKVGALLGLLSMLVSSCQPIASLCNTVGSCCDDQARVCSKPTVRALAEDLRDLEHHIEKYGSVVIKHPDVWGQARLTQYRQEFEQQMSAELPNFTETLQGSVAGSDQAYLADSFALSAAASSPPSAPAAARLFSFTGSRTGTTSVNLSGSLPPASPAPSSSSSSSSKVPPLPDQSDTFTAFKDISRTPVQMPQSLPFAGAKTGIVLEPSIYLDQKARYLNHLQDLRRINEGDDTADSPGYALNLVRIPVSILPGQCTEVGHGAEITMTLTPVLSEELLPMTFRNLVLNDLVDQIGLPITAFLNDSGKRDYFDPQAAADIDALLEFDQSSTFEYMLAHPDELANFRWKLSLQKIMSRPEWAWVDELLAETKNHEQKQNKVRVAQPDQPPKPAPPPKPGQPPKPGLTQAQQTVSNYRDEALWRLANANAVTISPVKSRVSRLPFAPSQMISIYGFDMLYHVAKDTFVAYGNSRVSKPWPDSTDVFIHLPDVQSYLQEELAGAYRFLSDPAEEELWQFCTEKLANAIRAHDTDFVDQQRISFKRAVYRKTQSDTTMHTAMAALAWAIIVEATLLSDQLRLDMKETAASKECHCLPDVWMDYYSPHPSVEARQQFNEYVKCRWPIHVFALDPAAQQQNIADTFSQRREMQLAVSLAFVSGQMSAQNMMRFARRIEFDFATIDLNSTDIGFSHGDNTFGWRFYPRFQTPGVESNATVIARDLIVGGPSKAALLRKRRLEPGIRECVAVVIMPSFVPYATMKVSSSWFRLNDPKCKTMDPIDEVKLSRIVKSIENCAENVIDADCYRDGELEMLKEKAKMLSERLPMQMTKVQIPYENTLGGFRMFNNGITDLAPELNGWYGSTSINPTQPTTLFLVGNHFSVFGTKAIAGGQEISTVALLSRQVAKVTIPANPILMGEGSQKFVDVNIATPYGVTRHLLIPAYTPPPDPAATDTTAAQSKGVAWKPASFDVAYSYGGLGITAPTATTDQKYRPPFLAIQAGDVDPAKYPTADVTINFDKKLNIDSIKLLGIPYDTVKKGFAISGDKITGPLFTSFGSRFGPEVTNPPYPLTVTTDLKFNAMAGGDPLVRKTGNSLTINWILSSSGAAKAASPTPTGGTP